MPKRPNRTERPARVASTAVDLLEHILADTELFRTADGVAFMRLMDKAGTRVVPVDSQELHDRIAEEILARSRALASDAQVNSIVSALAMKARTVGVERAVHTRVAYENGRYYIDLADDVGRVVVVEGTGWRLLKRSAVLFLRPTSMRALPRPAKGGDLTSFLRLLNIPKSKRLLVVAWLLECWRPNTPYVGLNLVGMQGAAKSTAQSLLRSLIDPNAENLRTAPTGGQDVAVAANNGHLLSFENLSRLSPALQDVLCTVLTGGAFAKRRLFTDATEALVQIKRPVVLNGIDAVVTRPDLLDRFIVIELPRIVRRRTHSEVVVDFEAMRPSVFGALLDLFSRALAVLPEVATEDLELPRMADFAVFGEAVGRAMGEPPGTFLKAYEANRRTGAAQVVEGSALALAIIAAVTATGELRGCFAEITAKLNAAQPAGARHQAWPRTGKAFGDEIRRLQPALEAANVSISKIRTKHGSRWSFKMRG